MHVADGLIVVSPSDVTAAVGCEFSWLRQLDSSLGRITAADQAPDAMMQRTSELGAAHEAHILDGLVAQFGDYNPATGCGVYHLPRPSSGLQALAAAATETLRLLHDGADVVYQGVIYRDDFLGYPDFLIRQDSGAWAVADAKLARHAKVSGLLQLAAYADQLGAAGIRVADEAYLELGSGMRSSHPVAEMIPVYRERRAHVQKIATEHLAEASAVCWGDRRYTACGQCQTCAVEVVAHRDLLLVANMRMSQRTKLLAAGIDTIDALAANTASVPGLSERSRVSLTAQARLQVQQDRPGDQPDGSPHVMYEIFDPTALAVLTEPDAGDIFFDFEGDPLWTDSDPSQSGLEYLFGVIEAPIEKGASPVFRSFWAHDRTQERQALVDFIDYVTARRSKHPSMHIYHYAPYEKSALLRLAGRYGICEDAVDNLLRDGVLVDLYAIVRSALRVSQPSYSIKKLEPLYMGDELRSGDVTTATDSIVEYARYCELRDTGERESADEKLASIADYNKYDCVSTLRLRNWLLDRAAECGIDLAPAGGPGADGATAGDRDRIDADRALVAQLTSGFAGLPRNQRTSEHQARALLAASLGYHQREDKPFWWAHFDRLHNPIDEWADTSGVMVIDNIETIDDWSKAGRQKTPHRALRVTGTIDGGKELDGTVRLLYEPGHLPSEVAPEPGCRGCTTAFVTWRDPDDPGVVEIEERSPVDEPSAFLWPVAITPNSPVPTGSLHTAIAEVASNVVTDNGASSGVMDLLRRSSPERLAAMEGRRHTDSAVAQPLPSPSFLADFVASLGHSYLAIQGPPGSGKTHTGARIVQTLIEKGWRVGVVAQSHRVVENFLEAVARTGVPADRIGKKPGIRASPGADRGWTPLTDNTIASWCADRSERGYVLGGTAWDFVNIKRVNRGQLDLLVIDEAGQFSLANTIAVSVAAQRLLLLGDPQQLPQVSQGTHPEPCNESALSWIMGGSRVISRSFGFFLSHSWRMHPHLCARVSTLSYDGRLESQGAVTGARTLAGVQPGIHVIATEHEGNSTSSSEEAAEVVRQIRRFLGTQWHAPDELTDDGLAVGPRPLTERDILVVAPYNAQVSTILRAVGEAGFDGIRVGTVDKFQGQQAPVVIVSMTASAPSEVPRGMGFLLNRNRINVAVSRAQWCTIIVRSPRLTDYLPTSPHELGELGAFIRLCGEPRGD